MEAPVMSLPLVLSYTRIVSEPLQQKSFGSVGSVGLTHACSSNARAENSNGRLKRRMDTLGAWGDIHSGCSNPAGAGKLQRRRGMGTIFGNFAVPDGGRSSAW